MTHRVRSAIGADILSWLDLFAEVREQFGNHAPDVFELFLQSSIAAERAYCVGDTGDIRGGVIISWPNDAIHIDWLATRSSHRGNGIATALIDHAISIAGDRAVEVVTFPDGHPWRESATGFYRSVGFSPAGRAPAPGGGEVWHRSTRSSDA